MSEKIPKNEGRQVCYDSCLQIETYTLSGVVQKFPRHFHEFYVVGVVERGRRRLWCRGRETLLAPGDLVLFNPGDDHGCAPVDDEPLQYRALNIAPRRLQKAVGGPSGQSRPPRFGVNTAQNEELAGALTALARAIRQGAPRPEREEKFALLAGQLVEEYGGTELPTPSNGTVGGLCAYMEEHFAEPLTLDGLARRANVSKSYLVRAFVRQVGVPPHRYLQTVRLNRARDMLRRGISPAQAAYLAGFVDQSHFTNSFKSFTGLTPWQYQESLVRAAGSK